MSGETVQRVLDYETTSASIITSTLSVFFCSVTLVFLSAYMAYCSIALTCIYIFICLIFSGAKIILLPKNIQHIADQLAGHDGNLPTFGIAVRSPRGIPCAGAGWRGDDIGALHDSRGDKAIPAARHGLDPAGATGHLAEYFAQSCDLDCEITLLDRLLEPGRLDQRVL